MGRIKAATKKGKAMGIKQDGKVEEKKIKALKAKMKTMKKGSKEHKAAEKKLEALKAKMKRRIKAATKKGKAMGIKQDRKVEEKKIKALKAKMKTMKKGSK